MSQILLYVVCFQLIGKLFPFSITNFFSPHLCYQSILSFNVENRMWRIMLPKNIFKDKANALCQVIEWAF